MCAGGVVGTRSDTKRRCIDLAYVASRKAETDTDQAGSNPALHTNYGRSAPLSRARGVACRSCQVTGMGR